MKVLLATALLMTTLAAGASAQESGVEDWEDRLMATRNDQARSQVFWEAAHAGGAGAREFLLRRLRGDLIQEQSWLALEAAAAVHLVDLPEVIVAYDRRLTREADRLRLWRIFVHSAVWRDEARALLLETVDRHRHDPRGAALLPVVAEAIPSSEGSGRDAIVSLLLSLHEDPRCGPLSNRAFAIGLTMPQPHRGEFQVTALLRIDETFALDAARRLLADEVEGTELLLLDALFDEPGPFLRAGLDQLLLLPDAAGMRIALLERIEEADGDLLAHLRYLLGGIDSPELDLHASQSLRRGGPKARALAFDRLRAGRFSTTEKWLRAILAEEIPDETRIAALDALSALTRRRNDRNAVLRWFSSGDANLDHEHLGALERAAPRSPELATLALSQFAHKASDWRRRAPLLRVLAALRAEPAHELAAKALEHPRWQVRLAAIEALVILGDRPALAKLAVASGLPRLRLARAAAAGLRRLTGESFGSNPEAWMRHVARLPRDWRPLPHPDCLPRRRSSEQRYAPNFYGLDLGSNRVVFVCDSSGSMEGPKIENLVQEIGRAIAGLDSDGAFNIVFFAEDARPLWSSIRRVEKRSRKRARDFAKRRQAGGGTNLWSGLDVALDDLEADTLVVLTDGQPTVGALTAPGAILAEFARRNRHLRLKVHTVELGALGSNFMLRLARDHGGHWVQIP